MEPFLGQITLFPYNFAPRNWAFCDGQILAISQNTALFSLLGTTYGGDGRTTFALPDLRGRVPLHSGNGSSGPGLSSRPLGGKGGVEQVTLSVAQLPSHNHLASLKVSEEDANSTTAAGNVLGNTAGNTYNTGTPDGSANSSAVNVDNAGGGQPLSVMQPYLGLNYCIALAGIFPSRN